ncbi:MAG: DUF366 family protein [Desulfotomaculales bacterium]
MPFFIQDLFVSEPILYDGSQLSSHWAYRTRGVSGDSILSFRGPCRVSLEKMVDLADVLSRSVIYSPDMLHFIVEHFDTDLEKTVYRQRLLVCIIKEILEERGVKVLRDGDDLYAGEKKLSVSIATVTPVSTMIHTGLNLTSEGVPVQAAGLLELGWQEEEVPSVARQICKKYVLELKSVYLARCKVRGVD